MKNFVFILALFILVSALGCPAGADSKKKIEKAKIQKKIEELKRQEKVEIKKLTESQQRLEKTQRSIKTCENRLWRSRVNVSKLRTKLADLNREQDYIAESAGKRLREIYKGDQIGLIHVILAAEDISTLFDRLYYQKLILKKDRELMGNLRQKSYDIQRSKRAVEREKRNITYSLKTMNRKKFQLNTEIQASEYLISRLRTDRAAYEQAQKELASLSRVIEKNIVKTVSKDTVSSTFIRPVAGTITSRFGWRKHPIFKSTKFHSGVDIAGPNRTPIKASNAGKVIHSGWYGGYGKVVIINHGSLQDGKFIGKKVSTLYAHLYSTKVKVGSYVKKGDIIGLEGSTGYSTGPHLHFEVRIEGKPINPLSFVK